MNKPTTPTDAPFLTMTAQQALYNEKPRTRATVFTELERVDADIKFNCLESRSISFDVRDKVDVNTISEILTSYGYKVTVIIPRLLKIEW